MWAYIKSFFITSVTEEKPEKKLSIREQSLVIRHNINSKLMEKGLKWTIAGWSQRLISHTDWTIKIKDSITLPYIEKKQNTNQLISAIRVPMFIDNKKVNLQKYLENYGQYNPNIKINYNLSTSFNESIEMKCVVVIIPKDTEIVHFPSKLTHKYEKFSNNSILVVSTQNNSKVIHEDRRKHNFDLEQTIPEDTNKVYYNICLEIPIIKYTAIKKLFIRDSEKRITGTIVYYLYLDHKKINENDIENIEEIFNDFKKEKYNFSK